jgi:hypothetical protein
MRTLFHAIQLALLPIQLFAQNLVPNPGFEDCSPKCSWIVSNYEFKSAVKNWEHPTQGSTDIYGTQVSQSCYSHPLSTSPAANGQEVPHSGIAMAGMYTFGSGCSGIKDYREYLQVKLIEPLIIGQVYYGSFWVSLGDSSMRATNNLGMYYSEQQVWVSTCANLGFVPEINSTEVITDKTGWYHVSGTFVAKTEAQYLLIGNFYDDANTSTIVQETTNDGTNHAYYFVDDIVVRPLYATHQPVYEFQMTARLFESSTAR